MKVLVHRFLVNDGGQDLIEYALLATFISLACYTAVTAVGDAVGDLFTAVATELQETGTP